MYWKCMSILSRVAFHFDYIDGEEAKLDIDLIIWDIACSTKKSGPSYKCCITYSYERVSQYRYGYCLFIMNCWSLLKIHS